MKKKPDWTWPDGKRIAAGDRNSRVYLWDPATGQELAKLEGDGSRLFALAFAADSQTLAVGSKTIIRLWDAVNAKELRQLGRSVTDDVTSHNNDVTLAFSNDGSMLVSGLVICSMRRSEMPLSVAIAIAT